ncbi:MAG TPA: hypothetical protein VMZ53_04465 [Kofleriaceae bacterium]|nr:hypothetical protein [Kofleriaceae bacterium]
MRAALFVAAFVAVVPSARADDTFESKAAGAQRVRRVEDLVWALTATCDQNDDTQNRQCRKLRDAKAAELANATLLVDADKDAFSVGAWNAQKKSVPLALDACIRCKGIDVAGKTWFVVGTKDGIAAPAWKSAKLVTGSLHDNARPFGDDASAKTWAKTATASNVQLLVKVGAKPKQSIENKNVLALEVLGYRVFSPCDGSVVAASPKSSAVELEKADKQACAPAPATPTGEAIESLTPAMISQTMKPVAEQAAQCGQKHGVHGAGKVKLTVSADGSVAAVELTGAFASSKAGECIEALAKSAAFPKTKKAKTVFSYPIKLP